MLGLWLQDLESLEAISQDEAARGIFLRLAAMSRKGTLPVLLDELDGDEELDSATKDSLLELARDQAFLLAVEDYFRRTDYFH